MNEIEKVNNDVVVSLATSSGFELAQRIGLMYSTSSMVPKQYQGQAGVSNCIIALDMARRLNASELMVMQNLHIIQGKPSWSSKFLIATINSCGKYEPLRFRTKKGKSLKGLEYTIYKWANGSNQEFKQVFNDELENIICVAYTSLKGSTVELESTEVSLEMAIKEGWYSKPGSKWQNMPEQMLRYRAASFWVSVYAPEISMGMSTSEELIDIEEYTPVNNVYTPRNEVDRVQEIKPINPEPVKPVKKKRLCSVCKKVEFGELEARKSLEKYNKIICEACNAEKEATPEKEISDILKRFSLAEQQKNCLKWLKETKNDNGVSYYDIAKSENSYVLAITEFLKNKIGKIDASFLKQFHESSTIKDYADGLIVLL